MADRALTLLMDRLRTIANRKQRFSFDVRGHSYVTTDIVVAYATNGEQEGSTDLEAILHHALDHDAIVSGHRDPVDGHIRYTSCRLFTDMTNAMAFARAQGQGTVYNWNRWSEVKVSAPVA